MNSTNPLKVFEIHKDRVQGFKESRDQVRSCKPNPSNPRTLDPLNSLGFTLIETVLVILIIGVLAVVAIPKVGTDLSQKGSIVGAAHMIASDIRYAQEYAMVRGHSKSIIFNSGSSSYSFSPSESLDPSGQLPPGIVIGSNFIITFNSLGEPTVGGGGSVSISGGGQTRTIRIENYTGKVVIQ